MSRPTETGTWWTAAEQLADHVRTGASLVEIDSPVALEPGELAHAHLELQAWRYLTLGSAQLDHRTTGMQGRLEEPRWHALGVLPIVATSHRLLVFRQAMWHSVWINSITELRPDLDAGRLELRFESDPPYLLAGPAVPYLAVVLATALVRSSAVPT